MISEQTEDVSRLVEYGIAFHQIRLSQQYIENRLSYYFLSRSSKTHFYFNRHEWVNVEYS